MFADIHTIKKRLDDLKSSLYDKEHAVDRLQTPIKQVMFKGQLFTKPPADIREVFCKTLEVEIADLKQKISEGEAHIAEVIKNKHEPFLKELAALSDKYQVYIGGNYESPNLFEYDLPTDKVTYDLDIDHEYPLIKPNFGEEDETDNGFFA